MVVKRALGYTRGFGNVLHAGGIESSLVQDLQARVQELFSYVCLHHCNMTGHLTFVKPLGKFLVEKWHSPDTLPGRCSRMPPNGRSWQVPTWSWACTTGHPASDQVLEAAANAAWPYAQLCASTYLNDEGSARELMA